MRSTKNNISIATIKPNANIPIFNSLSFIPTTRKNMNAKIGNANPTVAIVRNPASTIHPSGYGAPWREPRYGYQEYEIDEYNDYKCV